MNEDTHKTSHPYSIPEALDFVRFITDELVEISKKIPPHYERRKYVRHAEINAKVIQELVVESDGTVELEANLLFWIFLSCRTMQVNAPHYIPHVIKQDRGLGYNPIFFVCSEEEWKFNRIKENKHRAVSPETRQEIIDNIRGVKINDELAEANKAANQIMLSDHAKVAFLQRFCGININTIIAERFPHSVIDRRREEHGIEDSISVAEFRFLFNSKGECITVLAPGMTFNKVHKHGKNKKG